MDLNKKIRKQVNKNDNKPVRKENQNYESEPEFKNIEISDSEDGAAAKNNKKKQKNQIDSPNLKQALKIDIPKDEECEEGEGESYHNTTSKISADDKKEKYLVDDSFDNNDIGLIDDISIDSTNSQGNRLQSDDYNEYFMSKSKSERQPTSPDYYNNESKMKKKEVNKNTQQVNKIKKLSRSKRQENLNKESSSTSQCYGYKQTSNMTSQRESQSHFTSMEGPPRVYEEVMRQLEADIRKHIRIEHQLKLHIESVEDRVEELEREQEDYENQIEQLKEQKNEVEPYKKKIQTLQNDLKTKEEILDVKQILLEKQKSEIEELQKNNKNLQDEVSELNNIMKQLQQETVNLAKDLKVSKSQNLRDKEIQQKLLNRTYATQPQQPSRYNDPYESYLQAKHGLEMDAIESGISSKSRKSGKSGISAVSGNSGEQYVASINMVKSNQNMNNQMYHSYDRLSLSENRTLNNQNSMKINTVKNINQQFYHPNEGQEFQGNSAKNAISFVDAQQFSNEGSQSQNKKNNNQTLLIRLGDTNNIAASGQGSYTRSGKSNSESRKRAALHASSQDQTVQRLRQMNSKTQNIKNNKGQAGMKNLFKNQFNQSVNVLVNVPGGSRNNQTKIANTQSIIINSSQGASRNRMTQKQSKHSSLEKFSTALLYGTQSVSGTNKKMYVGGAVAGSGHVPQQLSGPSLQIKLQSTTKNQSSKKGNSQTQNIININSFTPDRLKFRQKIGMIPNELEGQKSMIISEAQGALMGTAASFDLNPSKNEFNDLQKAFSVTQDLNELGASQKNQQSRSQSSMAHYNQQKAASKVANQLANKFLGKPMNGKSMNKVNVVQLAGMNATLQAAHNSSQKLTSKEQLQNIYNTSNNNSNQKNYFKGNKNQKVKGPDLKNAQFQNSRNTIGIKSNYKTVGAANQHDNPEKVSRQISQMQQLKYSTNNLSQQKLLNEDQNMMNQTEHMVFMQNQWVCGSPQKSQKSQKSYKSQNQQSKNDKYVTWNQQQRMLSDTSNGANFVGQAHGPGGDTSSTGATGGTAGQGGPPQQRRCSSQLQQNRQPNEANTKNNLNNHQRDTSQQNKKNASQGSRNSNLKNAQNFRNTTGSSKQTNAPQSQIASLNNTQKMHGTSSQQRSSSNNKFQKQQQGVVVTKFGPKINKAADNTANYEQIQNILGQRQQNESRQGQQARGKRLSSTSSNRGNLPTTQSIQNNYQMNMGQIPSAGGAQQHSKNGQKTNNYLSSTNKQGGVSMPQRNRAIPLRNINSQSALSTSKGINGTQGQPMGEGQNTQHNLSTQEDLGNNIHAVADEMLGRHNAQSVQHFSQNGGSKKVVPTNDHHQQDAPRTHGYGYKDRAGSHSQASNRRK